ncbi:MAG: hypothetical protein KJ646_05285 [Nanoarchaeota archaeon]|nr:hypothetical protein [Nanoarchaeota archaeon]
MGWFNKKNEMTQKEEIPSLPNLPRLPELPSFGKKYFANSEEQLHQLPSFPHNSLGEKFSQNAIKEAVTGRKESEEVFDANESEFDDENQMMQKPLRKPLTKELLFQKREVPEEFREAARIVKNAEPIFIRIDKFEEGIKIFEKTKEKISEMDKLLKNIKKIKEEEELELDFWENEIQKLKGQIEKVDKDIFSKIE